MGTNPTRSMLRALELIANGETPAKAAKRFGHDITSVRRAMHRSGMKVRKPGRPKK